MRKRIQKLLWNDGADHFTPAALYDNSRARCDFEVLTIDDRAVYLADLNLGGRSLTNDAANVCAECVLRFGNLRIVYRDSIGSWAELIHVGGKFLAYATCARGWTEQIQRHRHPA
jgi:hypothetical protein